MSGKTDGQLAYEATLPFIGADLDGPPWRWEDLPPHHRESWEAGVAAGAAPAHERTAELLTEVNELRRRLGGLLTILLEGDEDDETVRRRAIDHVQRMLADEAAP